MVFYNERLKDGVYPEGYEVNNVYEELCEVIVQGIYSNNNHYMFIRLTRKKGFLITRHFSFIFASIGIILSY